MTAAQHDPPGSSSADEIRASFCASGCSAGRSASRMASSKRGKCPGRSKRESLRHERTTKDASIGSRPSCSQREGIKMTKSALVRTESAKWGKSPPPSEVSSHMLGDNSPSLMNYKIEVRDCSLEPARAACYGRRSTGGPRPPRCGGLRRPWLKRTPRPTAESRTPVPWGGPVLHTCGWGCGNFRTTSDCCCPSLGIGHDCSPGPAVRSHVEHVVSRRPADGPRW